MSKLIIYGVIALFLLPVVYSIIAAFTPEKTVSMQAIDADKSVKTGQQLYQKCAVCHGANGDGSDGYPSMNTIGKDGLYDKMSAFLHNASGSSNQAIMKGQLEGMSNDNLRALAEYISSFKPNENMKKRDNSYKQKKQELEFDTTNLNS